MITLNKQITRQLMGGDERGRQLVIELKPGDLIAFRMKGKRTRYTVSLHKVFYLAMLQFLEENYQERLATYEIRKKAGHKRLRKPKRPSTSFFNQQIKKAYAAKGGKP